MRLIGHVTISFVTSALQKVLYKKFNILINNNYKIINLILILYINYSFIVIRNFNYIKEIIEIY